MGTDKALLKLRGRPLVEHAAMKLSRICERVSILASTAEVASYGPLVQDIHPGCGPLGGIEAALQASEYEWSLVLPVDVPFVPAARLREWAGAAVRDGLQFGTRLSMWVVGGRPQPALAMLHRDLLPFVHAAIGRGEFKLLPALDNGTARLGEHAREFPSRSSRVRTFWPAEDAMWFANLNTPDDFAAAEQRSAALDT